MHASLALVGKEAQQSFQVHQQNVDELRLAFVSPGPAEMPRTSATGDDMAGIRNTPNGCDKLRDVLEADIGQGHSVLQHKLPLLMDSYVACSAILTIIVTDGPVHFCTRCARNERLGSALDLQP